jgi:hypothetical protein
MHSRVLSGWWRTRHDRAGRGTRGFRGVRRFQTAVVVLRRDQMLLHSALVGFELKKIVPHPEGVSGQGTIVKWEPGERRASDAIRWREGTIMAWEPVARLELPVHQVNAYPTGKSEMSFQIMFGEADGAEWWYRRYARVRRRIDVIGCKRSGEPPYLAPEIMLLFKAKTMRPYDLSDFEAVLPTLSTEAREWLRAALTIAHPRHPWIERL